MDKSKPNILILRLSSIGDIILSSAFIRQVRNTFPSACIDFVIKKDFLDLVKYNPNLNQIYTFDKSSKKGDLKGLRSQLRENKYDFIFDIHNNFRTNYLHRNNNSVKIWKIKKNKLKRALLVFLRINLYNEIPSIPNRYLAVGKAAGVRDDNKGLELFWSPEIEERINEIINKEISGNSYLVLAPGAGFYTKQWPKEYFLELINQILKKRSEKIVLLGGITEIEMFKEFSISDRVVNLIGQLSLLESALITKKAQVIVSNDSGLMHMATAVGTPVVAIFGSTVKELGFFPFRANHVLLQNEELNCRPCSHVGKNYCPRKHFKCMMEISPNDVYQKLIGFLEN